MFENIDVIIPIKTNNAVQRVINFNWVINRYHKLAPEANLLIPENDDLLFNKAKAINEALDSSNKEFVIINDADTILDFSAVDFAMSWYRYTQNKNMWFILYGEGKYLRLPMEESEEILKCDPGTEYGKLLTIGRSGHMLSWAGAILIPREGFEKINGVDERFQGYGYEDNAIQVAADTLIAPHMRADFCYIMHLWHPEPYELQMGQPMIEQNRNMFYHYHNMYGNYQAMAEYVKGNRVRNV